MSIIQQTPLLNYFVMYIILVVLCTLYVGWGVLMQLWITYSDTLFILTAISGSGVHSWRSGWLWPSAHGHGLIMPSYRCNRMPPPKATRPHTHTHMHALTQTSLLMIKLKNRKACTQTEYCRPFWPLHKATYFSFSMLYNLGIHYSLIITGLGSGTMLQPPYKARQV